jgi:ferredoxin
MAKTIEVRHVDDTTSTFTGTHWHVDDRGQLHVNNDKEPIATFARDYWAAVESQVEQSFRCHACRVYVLAADEGPTDSDGGRWCQDCAAEARSSSS